MVLVSFEAEDFRDDVIEIGSVDDFCLMAAIYFRAVVVNIMVITYFFHSFFVRFWIFVPIFDSTDRIRGVVDAPAVSYLEDESVAFPAEVGEPFVVDSSCPVLEEVEDRLMIRDDGDFRMPADEVAGFMQSGGYAEELPFHW